MAQLILNDRVKETTTATGTGTINLAGAEEGFETFVVGVGNGKETFYSIFAGTEFEVGRGTVTDIVYGRTWKPVYEEYMGETE